MRITFGAIFAMDGIFRWILFQPGLAQGTIVGQNAFGFAFLHSDWFTLGRRVALGETFGGLALIFGLF